MGVPRCSTIEDDGATDEYQAMEAVPGDVFVLCLARFLEPENFGPWLSGSAGTELLKPAQKIP
jgi:hypothetical protein